MVEQALEIADGDPRRRLRVLTLLAAGGFVVLWWALMTGTAHAAESPTSPEVPVHALGHGPAARVVHGASETVKHAVRPHSPRPVEQSHAPVRTTLHAASHVVRQASTTTATIVPKAGPSAGQFVRQVASTPVAPTLHQLTHDVTHVISEVAPAVGTSARAAHTGYGTEESPTAAILSTPESTTSSDSARGATSVGTALLPVQTPHQTDEPAPVPSGSDADFTSGSGCGLALVEQSGHVISPALTGRNVDVRPTRLLEPAYPPGCSPD